MPNEPVPTGFKALAKMILPRQDDVECSYMCTLKERGNNVLAYVWHNFPDHLG